MIRQRLSQIPWRFALLWLCLGFSGCILVYHYKSVTVSVHDAETGAPIVGANISTIYPYILAAPMPTAPNGITDKNGSVVMEFATLSERWNQASASGYITDHNSLFGGQATTASMDFRLYKLPEPSLTFILPDGYHGPVMFDLHPSSAWIQGNIGQRQFTYVVPASGYVSVQATPLLTREVFVNKVNFQTASNIPIPIKFPRQIGPTPSVTEIGGEGANNFQSDFRRLWVVGNKSDFDPIDTKINGLPNSRNFNFKAFNQMFDEAAAQSTTSVSH